MNISNSLSWLLNSIQCSHSEHILLQTLLYTVTSILQVFCQLSSLTIAYPNILFPNIIGSNVCQFQNSFTTHYLVKISLLTISYKMNSSGNVYSLFSVPTKIIHENSQFYPI